MGGIPMDDGANDATVATTTTTQQGVSTSGTATSQAARTASAVMTGPAPGSLVYWGPRRGGHD